MLLAFVKVAAPMFSASAAAIEYAPVVTEVNADKNAAKAENNDPKDKASNGSEKETSSPARTEAKSNTADKRASRSENVISDANLKKAINKNVLKRSAPYDQDISAADIADIDRMVFEKSGVEKLDGLENATALQEVEATGNSISDLKPIADNTWLEWLSLDGNKIKDVSPLKNISDLEGLNISKNSISDISPLKDFEFVQFEANDQEISLDADAAGKVSNPLKARDGKIITDLSNLKNLKVEGNELVLTDKSKEGSVEFSAEDGAFTGTVTVKPSEAPAENVIVDANLKLALNRDQLKRPAPFDQAITADDMKQVKKLVVKSEKPNPENKKVKSIEGVQYATNAIIFDMRDNAIKDLTPIPATAPIRALLAGQNKIEDISHLPKITELRTVDISDNPIKDFSPLAKIDKLVGVELDNTGIKSDDLGIFAPLENFKIISIKRNKLKNIDALSNCGNLKRIFVDENELTDVSKLAKISSLTTLTISKNHIADISAFKDFKFSTLKLRTRPLQ